MAEASLKLGRVSLAPRGAYDADAVYRRLDIVEYEGSSYLALADGVSGMEPAEGASYMLLAEKGGPGPQGEQGKPGPQGEPGKDGTSFAVLGRYDTLDELMAAHPAGSEGDAWAVGSAEDNDVYLWDVDAQAWRNIGSLQGPPGPAGADGKDGQNGAQGPQGPAGGDGKSAYQYAVEGGYAGTEEEFGRLLADAATKRYVDDLVGDISSLLDAINGEAA